MVDNPPALVLTLWFGIGFFVALYTRLKERKPMKVANWFIITLAWPIAAMETMGNWKI